MATLKYVNVEGVDEVVHLGSDRPQMIIGRNKDCDLRTNNNTVSRRHARFEYRDGEYWIVDLKSANGTYYKRNRITETMLENGETVFVGNLPVEFLLEQADLDSKTTIEEPETFAPGPVDVVEDLNMTSAVEGLDPVHVADMMSTKAYAEVPKPTSGYAMVPDSDVNAKDKPAPTPETASASASESEPESASVREAEASKPIKYTRHSTQDMVEMQAQWVDREQEFVDRVADLEFQIGERDDEIRSLNNQLADLGKQLESFEAAMAGRAAEDEENVVRIEELERVLTAAEVERMGLEEQLEAFQDQKSVIDSLKTENEAKDSELADLREKLAAAEEKAAKAMELVSKLPAIQKELEETKIANRSYVRRISRLLESGGGDGGGK